MVKTTSVEGLSDDERELLIEALRALRHQRGKAWNAACDAALAVNKRQPSLRSAGIVCIPVMLPTGSSDCDPPVLEVLPSHSSGCDPLRRRSCPIPRLCT